MEHWLSLVIALPTNHATARMRAWRALKGCGAAVLRDGVYLLPDRPDCRSALQDIERDILASSGSAYLLPVCDPQGARFVELFARDADYAGLAEQIAACLSQLQSGTALVGARQVRKLRKALSQLATIDFFPGAALRRTEEALLTLEHAVSRALSPDEPNAAEQPLEHLAPADFQGRIWATRRRPWIDRLASAWLILRCIDPAATFLWLDRPEDCPAEALGFDFDGARFSHVGARVSFETLQASFALERPGLSRLAALVHYLDVGGQPPAEAPGVETVLAGLRETIPEDHQLLTAACGVFDALLAHFAKEASAHV